MTTEGPRNQFQEAREIQREEEDLRLRKENYLKCIGIGLALLIAGLFVLLVAWLALK